MKNKFSAKAVAISILFMITVSLFVPSGALTECETEQVQGEYDFAVDYLNKMYDTMYCGADHDLTADTVWSLTESQKWELYSKIEEMELEFTEGMLPYPLERIIGDIDIPYLGDAAKFGSPFLVKYYPTHISQKILYYKYEYGETFSSTRLGEVEYCGVRVAENGIVFFNFAFSGKKSTSEGDEASWCQYRYFDMAVCDLDGKYVVLCVLEGGAEELPMPFDFEEWKAGKIAVLGMTEDPQTSEAEPTTEVAEKTSVHEDDDFGEDAELIPWAIVAVAVAVAVIEGALLFVRRKS